MASVAAQFATSYAQLAIGHQMARYVVCWGDQIRSGVHTQTTYQY